MTGRTHFMWLKCCCNVFQHIKVGGAIIKSNFKIIVGLKESRSEKLMILYSVFCMEGGIALWTKRIHMLLNNFATTHSYRIASYFFHLFRTAAEHLFNCTYANSSVSLIKTCKKWLILWNQFKSSVFFNDTCDILNAPTRRGVHCCAEGEGDEKTPIWLHGYIRGKEG